MDMIYGVTLTADDELGFVVRCRDIPTVLTWGESPEAAEAQAEDAVVAALLADIEWGHDIPTPTPLEAGEVAVVVPLAVAAKAAVYRAWKRAGITKVELAARMGVAEGEVRRILDPRHGTRLDKLDAAARALGERLVVGLAA